MSKRIIIILTFFVSISIFAQNDIVIKDIKVKYLHIKNNLELCDTVMNEICCKSTEGGVEIAYFEKSELKLITVTGFGEMGKNIIEYYFNNDSLFFAYDRNFKYNRPIHWNKQKAQENGDSISFDQTKTIVIEDRYYFNNGKLILWLDNDKKEVDLTKGTNTVVGQGLIAHAIKTKEKLKKYYVNLNNIEIVKENINGEWYRIFNGDTLIENFRFYKKSFSGERKSKQYISTAPIFTLIRENNKTILRWQDLTGGGSDFIFENLTKKTMILSYKDKKLIYFR